MERQSDCHKEELRQMWSCCNSQGIPLLPKAACPYSLAAVLSGWKVHACGYISVPAWEKLLSSGESALYAELGHTCQ